jgi:transcriptional regulator with XRE-family HTH domain
LSKLRLMSEQSHPGTAVPTFTIHDRLRKAREAVGLDQQELADAIGVARTSVSNYELGHTTRLKAIVLRQWALRCGVPLAWLHTGLSDEAPTPGGSDQRVDEFKQTRLAA